MIVGSAKKTIKGGVVLGSGGVPRALPAEGAGSQDPAVAAHLLLIDSSVADLGKLPTGPPLLNSRCSYSPAAAKLQKKSEFLDTQQRSLPGAKRW